MISKLGGWWRIWVIVAALLVLWATLVSVSNEDHTESFTAKGEPWALACIPFTKRTDESVEYMIEKENYERALESEIVDVEGQLVEVRPGDPRYSTPEKRGFARPSPTYVVNCSSWSSLLVNLVQAFLFAALIAAAGLLGRWVYRGFQKKTV